MHPSMLPDLRGPAPIAHTLLKRRSHTGVTLQTMHPTRFDQGSILAQTPSPGISVPPECTPDELIKTLGPLGADSLCNGISDGLCIPPLKDIQEGMADPQHLDHTPKLTSEDRHIDWSAWTADEVLLRDRVLGRLWDTQTYSRRSDRQAAVSSKRVTFHGPWTKQRSDLSALASLSPGGAGEPVLFHTDDRMILTMGIRTIDKHLVVPSAATIEGEKKEQGLPTLIKIWHEG